MNNTETLREDLRYVKRAVERSNQSVMPLGIAAYWALAVLVGFSMVDFAPAQVGLFWMIAGPLGFVASSYFGALEGRKTGSSDRATGMRIMWHFLGMMVAILLSVLLVYSHELSPAGIGRLILLLLALAYFTAGLHFSRSLIWTSLLLAAGYVAVGFFSTFAWTALGVLTCLALLGAGFAGRRDGQA
jgi:hypothetical protein